MDCNDYGDALNIWLSGFARSNDEMPEVKDNGGRRGRDRGSILGCDGFVWGLQDRGLNSLMYARGQIVDLPPYMKYIFRKER